MKIRTFEAKDYQFKGELCNTGYKIFEYTPLENAKVTKQGAILIDTRLSDELIRQD